MTKAYLQLIQHGTEILLAAGFFLHITIVKLEPVETPFEGDGPLHNDSVSVDFRFVGIRSFVEYGDLYLGTVWRVAGGILPDQILEVSGSVRASRSSSQADLYGGQDGTLPGPILARDEVNVSAELHFEFAMAHKVLHVDLFDDTGLGRLSGSVDASTRATVARIGW